MEREWTTAISTTNSHSSSYAPTTDVVVVERPHTPTEHDIFEKVFLNSSPPNFQTLHKANTVLSTTISRGILNTPTKRYIHKLADETERLNTRHIL